MQSLNWAPSTAGQQAASVKVSRKHDSRELFLAALLNFFLLPGNVSFGLGVCCRWVMPIHIALTIFRRYLRRPWTRFESMSRLTPVWYADQRQAEPFVTAAGCIVSLPGGKQTDRKCLECAVTYQLNHDERGFQIPITAGGHAYTQQTGTQHSRLSQPFKRTRPSCPSPILFPFGVPLEYGRKGIK